MSQEAPNDLDTSSQNNEEGPDYLSFYISQITELLSTNVFLPFAAPIPSESKSSTLPDNASPLFGNPLGNEFTDFKKSRLQPLLRQSVFSLSQEVDQMLGPVHSIHKIRQHLQYRKDLPSNLAAAASQDDARNCRNKRLKQSSLPSSKSKASNDTPNNCHVSREDSVRDGENVDISGPEKSNDLVKKCSDCHTMETSKMSNDPERSLKSLCNTCEQKKEVAAKDEQKKEVAAKDEQKKDSVLKIDVDDDLLFFIEKYPTKVEATVSEYSKELSETLGSMEKKLEGLLDMVLSCCRTMTITEKQQLRKLIQKLPPRNFHHIVEIIQHRKQTPCRKDQCDDDDDNEINVDLDKQDVTTLWRLYYYVKAVENAKKLSLQSSTTPAR